MSVIVRGVALVISFETLRNELGQDIRQIRKAPGFSGVLRLIDKGVARLPSFRTIGDHMLLYFERVEG